MRSKYRLRSTAAALGIAVLVSLGLLAAGAVAAGAQTAADSGPCDYTVSPVIVRPPGATVTVQGVAPPGATVFVFVAGVLQPNMPILADPLSGAWFYQFFATRTAEVTVSYGTQYPPTACAVSPAQAEINRLAQASLPRTGSGHVEATVLLALALVAVGSVLVVAVRRHDGVRGRRNT